MKNFFSLILILFCFTLSLHAQWKHTGPEGGIVKKIVTLNGVALCVTAGGVYRSVNNGENWVMQSSSLPDEVNTIITHANKFYASTTSGIFSSADGLKWEKINVASYYLVYSNGTNMLAYFNGKLHMSSNGGIHFYLSTGAYAIAVDAPITAIGSVLYLGTFSGVWYSNSGGAGWSSMNSGVGNVTDLITIPGGLLITASKGIYKQNGYTGGSGFILSGSGIPAGFTATKIIKGSGKYFVTVSSLTEPHLTLYSSSDGNAWVPDNGNYPIASYFFSDYLFNASVICNSKGIFKSTDKGKTWVATHTGIKAQVVTDMETGNDRIYASVSNRSKGATDGGIYASSDAGATWNKLSLPDTLAVEKIVVKNTAIIALVIEPTKAGYALFKSADEGVTWAKLTGYTNPLWDINYANNTLFITNSYINRDIMDRSVDFGATWQQISASGFPIVTKPLEINTTIGTTIFANIGINLSAGGGVFKSEDNGITWSAINNGIHSNVNIVSLTAIHSTLFATYNSFNGFSILYRSTNNGESWTQVTGPMQPYSITDVQGDGGSIFASTRSNTYGVDSGYVFQSKDNGDTWQNISGNMPFAGMGKIQLLNGKPFIAPPGYSVWSNEALLPVTFLSIGANRTDEGNRVTWKVAGETKTLHYEVERSTDSRNFSKAATLHPASPSALQQSYSWVDATHKDATVYYRIKCVGLNGDFTYSNIAKLDPVNKAFGFAIAPNPVVGSVLHVQFKNQAAGKYSIRVHAGNGANVYSTTALHGGANSVQSIYLPAGIAKGFYWVSITSQNGSNTTLPVVLK